MLGSDHLPGAALEMKIFEYFLNMGCLGQGRSPMRFEITEDGFFDL